jgi:hypothetical protein
MRKPALGTIQPPVNAPNSAPAPECALPEAAMLSTKNNSRRQTWMLSRASSLVRTIRTLPSTLACRHILTDCTHYTAGAVVATCIVTRPQTLLLYTTRAHGASTTASRPFSATAPVHPARTSPVTRYTLETAALVSDEAVETELLGGAYCYCYYCLLLLWLCRRVDKEA